MASTYSTNLKIELIATGEQVGVWGDSTNDNFVNVFEEAIVGTGSPDFTTDADLTISLVNSVNAQTARNLYLNVVSTVVGGLTATRNLIVPTINKNYIVKNATTGGRSIIVKTSAGTGITIPNGFTVPLYVNGTNVVAAYDYIPSLTLTSLTNSGLTADRVTYAGAGGLLSDSASLTFDGTILSSPRLAGAFNGTVGVTTPSTGAFTSGAFTSITSTGDGTFSGTGQIKLPAGTTAQRSGGPANGMIRYNSDQAQFEGYAAGQWGGIGGAQAGGAIQVNKTTATTDYTIAAGENGFSVGPITVAGGVTITIASGQRWLVL